MARPLEQNQNHSLQRLRSCNVVVVVVTANLPLIHLLELYSTHCHGDSPIDAGTCPANESDLPPRLLIQAQHLQPKCTFQVINDV